MSGVMHGQVGVSGCSHAPDLAKVTVRIADSRELVTVALTGTACSQAEANTETEKDEGPGIPAPRRGARLPVPLAPTTKRARFFMLGVGYPVDGGAAAPGDTRAPPAKRGEESRDAVKHAHQMMMRSRDTVTPCSTESGTDVGVRHGLDHEQKDDE